MRIHITFILVMLLLSISCNNSGNLNNGNIDSKDEILEEVKPELSETIAKPKSSLDELLSVFEKAGNKIPGEFHNLLLSDKQKELLDFDSGSNFYSLMPWQKIDEHFLLMIKSDNFDCTAINCQTEFNFILVNEKDELVSRFATGGTYQTDPDFGLMHEAFIRIKWVINDFEENDAGAMESTGKSETFIHYITIIENNLCDLSSLTKKQMRIQRNLIFARYGYKFKSKDLSDYFSKYKWYNPANDDVKNQLTENDKELITEITKLENKK